MTYTPDTHQALYTHYSTQYETSWPRDALCAIGHSFALTYGMLPRPAHYTQSWAMPSDRLILKIYPTLGAYRRDVLTTYPYLKELPLWGTDVLHPMQTVRCLRCDRLMQTRNPAKWHLHAKCRQTKDESGTWMNADAVSEVRDYDDCVGIGQPAVRRKKS